MLRNPDSERPPLRILTNFERFPESWTVPEGEHGTARIARTFDEFVNGLGAADVLLLNGDVALVYRLCLYFALFPWKRRTLIAVDLVLGYPDTPLARLQCVVKKALLRGVDHFINYFKYSDGYARFYGITSARSSFVHFKPNIRHRHETVPVYDGEYVLCFGRSRRDYDTFFRAVAELPFPAAIPEPNFAQLNANGSRFTYRLDRLPPNVTLLKDDKTPEAMIRAISGARIVALPIVKNNLLAGVSVYLDAMLLGKCVIITEGAGSSDVLTDEALFVSAGDAAMLARTIRLAWEDDELRLRTARSGYRHAASLGGEPELRLRILNAITGWLRARV
jgi:glycosyltransferase involved in cell wall biosynthesis